MAGKKHIQPKTFEIPIQSFLGPFWGLCWALGAMLVLEPCWDHVGAKPWPCCGHVGAMLGHAGVMLAMLGLLCWGYIEAMLGDLLMEWDFCKSRTLSPSRPTTCPDQGVVLGPMLEC